ncbi:glycosyltransferase [Altererythrobacter buctensis]|uniref:Glycosyltransferase n=2 Tax=Alteraurantiacibacter buctensis TaxID=1503981 RepID=A0A844Z6C8_9SPHN|nr:glycosyltransferase [Alteraurantiacibacter buctensis]
MRVSVVIPMLNEAAALPALAPVIAALDPPPHEVVCVDGGSADASVALAQGFGWRVVECERGRGRQINAGVAAATGDAVVVLHADTFPPPDALAVVAQVLADPGTVLAGFTPIIRGPDKTRWGTTAHNWAKTWYAPLLFHPVRFARGLRLLFGDHGMFFRRADYLAAGGCDPQALVMEEAELCLRMATLGRVRLVPRAIETSDRRIAQWGALRANWIYLKVGILWGLGARRGLERFYPDIR